MISGTNKGIPLYLFSILILALSASTLSAAGYPKPFDDYINDWAGVINKVDYDRLHKMLELLEHQTGIEIVVVTIYSIYDYDVSDNTLEPFATNLFNSWGIGHKDKQTGVLILVATEDRKVRIELGQAFGRMYDAAMQEVVDDFMLPYFKLDDYSRGIYEGARAVRERITEKVSWFSYYKWHILLGILIIVFVLAGINFLRKGKKGWGWTFLAAAGILLLLLIKLLKSSKSVSGFGGGSSGGGGASGSW